MSLKIDPRLARMAAALRAKPLTSEEIKKTRAKDFRTFGIEVPRGQLDHYRQALLKEIERQEVQQEKKDRAVSTREIRSENHYAQRQI